MLQKCIPQDKYRKREDMAAVSLHKGVSALYIQLGEFIFCYYWYYVQHRIVITDVLSTSLATPGPDPVASKLLDITNEEENTLRSGI